MEATGGKDSPTLHPGTEKVRFLRIKHAGGGDLPKLTMEPEIAARNALKEYAPQFGIGDPFKDLELMATTKSSSGNHIIKLEQVQDGVRVYGAQLVVRMDEFGRILAINGEISPAPPVELTPTLSPQQAREAALTDASTKHEIARAAIEAEAPQLYVYNPALFGKGENRNFLAWGINLHSLDSGLFARFVLVDVHDGSTLLDLSRLSFAYSLYRKIYNNKGEPNPLPGVKLSRIEGQGPVAVQEVNDAYDFTGIVYDYFWNHYGRDRIGSGGDGNPIDVVSTVRHCYTAPECPMESALWDNGLRQLIFGEGWVVDDVVGHEYTHGIQWDEQIYYDAGEAGAIRESLADTFGEIIDLTNYRGNDDGSVRWMIGEDLPAGVGYLRHMQNPALKSHPDRITSTYYDCSSNATHTNCGVGNRAVSLIVDGGYFYGQSFPALDIERPERIYYDAMTSLTSGSNYLALYNALNDSCDDLVGTYGITAAMCVDLEKALAAVDMYHIPCVSPDIKANNSNGPISVSLSTPVKVEYTLDIADQALFGVAADWWAAALYNDVYYYYDGEGWTTQAVPFKQESLHEVINPLQIYNSTMPVGTTLFFFGVDLKPGGGFNAPVRVDYVKVTAQ
jgi:Zn-dependent metalloprotease